MKVNQEEACVLLILLGLLLLMYPHTISYVFGFILIAIGIILLF